MPAPTVETVTDSGSLNIPGGSTHSISTHTVTSATRLMALVSLGSGREPNRTVSGISWDTAGTPQAFSLVGKIDDGSFETAEIWQLNNPTAGNKNCTITIGDTIGQLAWGLIGVLNPGATGTPANGQNTTANPSITVADTANDDLVFSVLASDAGGGTAPSANAVQLWAYDNTDSSFVGQRQTATGADTVCAFTDDAVPAGWWVVEAVAIHQAAGAAPEKIRTVSGAVW